MNKTPSIIKYGFNLYLDEGRHILSVAEIFDKQLCMRRESKNKGTNQIEEVMKQRMNLNAFYKLEYFVCKIPQHFR